MIKSELIQKVAAANPHLFHRDVERIINIVLDEITSALARGDSVRLLAVASIGAGVDLSGLSVGDFAVSDQGAVTVTLPHAEIQYVDVDSEATEILERDTGIFTKGDADLETEARQVAETVLVDQATQNGIVETAEENAVKAVESLLAGLGYTDTTVVFAG